MVASELQARVQAGAQVRPYGGVHKKTRISTTLHESDVDQPPFTKTPGCASTVREGQSIHAWRIHCPGILLEQVPPAGNTMIQMSHD